MPERIKVSVRFLGSLKVFLNKLQHTVVLNDRPAVKDTLEALGVPHTEIAEIIVNGKPKKFSYQLKNNDKVLVYPHKPPAAQPRAVKFVVDSHLGKLVRHLRLLGFDAVYKNTFPDAEIVAIAVKEKRIVLTRDIGLLKNKLVRYGYFPRSVDADKQLKEVLGHFELYSRVKPFTRCISCNGKFRRIAKSKIADQLPPKVKKYYNRFYVCDSCGKIYWQGSHYEKLVKIVERVKKNRH